MFKLWHATSGALLEVAFPRTCVLCGRGCAEAAFEPDGPRVAGLRRWDRAMLCRSCCAGLAGSGSPRTAPVAGLCVRAAAATSPGLAAVIGSFKYHGVRGLAWPLARLLASVVPGERRVCLVPIPLHYRRRRSRGFNQAEILARLVARGGDFRVRTDVLARVRATRQQATIADRDLRLRNTAAAFTARPASLRGEPMWLVDDLVTSGATAASAAAALHEEGWRVRGVLAVGAAGGRSSTPVDTVDGGF